jgi:hypothetical protein
MFAPASDRARGASRLANVHPPFRVPVLREGGDTRNKQRSGWRLGVDQRTMDRMVIGALVAVLVLSLAVLVQLVAPLLSP